MHVGVGWAAPSIMSGHTEVHDRVGRFSGGNADGHEAKSAAIRNTARGLLTSNTKTSVALRTGHAGLAHMFGVCMLELSIMARGKGKQEDTSKVLGMPKFVDFRLSAQQKADFLAWTCDAAEAVAGLQRLCDSGYRVGCTWAGEQQAYTVSLTCRDSGSPNNGYCMTSYAGDLLTAVTLALYKHEVATGGVWVTEAVRDVADFG